MVVFLCVAIQIPAFSRAFYRSEYEKQATPERIKVSMSELMLVTDRMLNYMSGDAPDLVIEVDVGGERREFFNQREKDHMVDVRNLMILSIWIRNIAICAFALSFLAFIALKPVDWRKLAKAWQLVSAGFCVLLLILAGMIIVSFDRTFVLFHELFFSNDLWILDYSTDLLLNIVPTEFFTDIAARIGYIFAGLVALSIGVSTACLRVRRRA
jgi:integral membrane protein (TIGR01906 family)